MWRQQMGWPSLDTTANVEPNRVAPLATTSGSDDPRRADTWQKSYQLVRNRSQVIDVFPPLGLEEPNAIGVGEMFWKIVYAQTETDLVNLGVRIEGCFK